MGLVVCKSDIGLGFPQSNSVLFCHSHSISAVRHHISFV